MSKQICLGHSSNHGLNKTNSATLVNEKLKGKFISPNVVNLSRRNLTNNEISVLSKGLKFVPTPRVINKALINEELEVYGRKLRLVCGIFVVMRGSLVMIFLRKKLILQERMQQSNYI